MTTPIPDEVLKEIAGGFYCAHFGKDDGLLVFANGEDVSFARFGAELLAAREALRGQIHALEYLFQPGTYKGADKLRALALKAADNAARACLPESQG